MSKQLAVSAAFSIFAMTAVALLGPYQVSGQVSGPETAIGATNGFAAPTFSVELPLAD